MPTKDYDTYRDIRFPVLYEQHDLLTIRLVRRVPERIIKDSIPPTVIDFPASAEIPPAI